MIITKERRLLIQEEIDQNMWHLILDLFQGTCTEITIPYVTPSQVIEYVTSLGAIDIDEKDINGWEMDYVFWIVWSEDRYMISGSGYGKNGCYVTMEKEKEKV